MSDQGIEQKPSETAFFTAMRRAIAHMVYGGERFGPDRLAQVFLPAHYRFLLKIKGIREGTRARLNEVFPGMNEYLIARTAYFDRLFVGALKEKIPQIVLLGAGYDSRAYRFAKLNEGTRIFELDAAATQKRKIVCLKKGRIEIPGQVKFAPINFNKESLEAVLEAAGYDRRERTLFLWEGVSYYLDEAAVDATLGFVRGCLHPENALAFDYTIPITAENMGKYYGAEEFAQSMGEHHAREALLFSIPEGGIESFLGQRGLKAVEHLDDRQIEQVYLLQDDGTPIGEVAGYFRFALAAPRSE